ncbi:TetR/AcrR family transcriptional regulator [Streptomyces sp. NPDC085481]|uniref:TetR/AcrR family transcriptional regulator n=1 Tax=Streptomyces sp. NPDC085481 TaxID=3365727 RepID=UPI0037D3544F
MEGLRGARVSGLRELKKERTRRTLSETAIELFLEKGFDAVSVAEIAAAAEVSKPTLFRYFPTKEDLVLYRFSDHEEEAAEVVAGRPAGTSPLDALQAYFLDGLERRDPVTGLCDVAVVLAFQRLVFGTPALVARLYGYIGRTESALGEALAGASGGDPLRARLAGGQIAAVLRILAEENVRRIAAGESADAVYGDAVEATKAAFRTLREGLPYG